MPSARTILLPLVLAALAAACAPPALDAEHASGTSAESAGKSSGKSQSKSKSKSSDTSTTGDDDDATGDDDDTAASGTTKKTSPSKEKTTGGDGPPASFSAAYKALEGPCAGCHSGGGHAFFGDDEASSYTTFKDSGLAVDPSPLVTKGEHKGPALTTEEEAAVKAWIKDET